MEKKRKDTHKAGKQEIHDFEVGQNVFIKNDKSKLKQRSPHIITKLKRKKDGEWAVVQKNDSQFRAKEYEVKLQEITPIPGYKKGIPHEVEDEIEPNINAIRDSTEQAKRAIAKLLKVTLKTCYQSSGDYEELLRLIEEDDEIQMGETYDLLNADTESITHSDPPPEDDNDSDFPRDTDSTGYETPTSTSNQHTSTSSTLSDDSPQPPPPRNSPVSGIDSDNDLNLEILADALQDITTDLQIYNRMHPLGPPRRSSRISKPPQLFQAGTRQPRRWGRS